MAAQVGMGLSKAALLVGTAFATPILIRNGSLSDIFGELVNLLKKIENNGGRSSNSDAELSKHLVSQVHQLAAEIRQLASARSITILPGNSEKSGIMSAILPVAACGALGYGYMWWKRLSFSDVMYVTKKSMAEAVSSMRSTLEQLSATITATKRQLAQRIEGLDRKMQKQHEMSLEIKNKDPHPIQRAVIGMDPACQRLVQHIRLQNTLLQVTGARTVLENLDFDLQNVRNLIQNMDGQMDRMQNKEDLNLAGVRYLCKFVERHKRDTAELLENGPRHFSNRFIQPAESRSLKGLQFISEFIETGEVDKKN